VFEQDWEVGTLGFVYLGRVMIKHRDHENLQLFQSNRKNPMPTPQSTETLKMINLLLNYTNLTFVYQ
jgi:hypothetical protein